MTATTLFVIASAMPAYRTGRHAGRQEANQSGLFGIFATGHKDKDIPFCPVFCYNCKTLKEQMRYEDPGC
jgi:hypothetical protein